MNADETKPKITDLSSLGLKVLSPLQQDQVLGGVEDSDDKKKKKKKDADGDDSE